LFIGPPVRKGKRGAKSNIRKNCDVEHSTKLKEGKEKGFFHPRSKKRKRRGTPLCV